jgi:hypothetical protein
VLLLLLLLLLLGVRCCVRRCARRCACRCARRAARRAARRRRGVAVVVVLLAGGFLAIVLAVQSVVQARRARHER